MANEQNLITPQEVNARKTPEERKAAASKAGKASAEKRRQKKSFQELCRWGLSLPLKTGDVDEITAMAEASGKNMTVNEAAVLAVCNKALKGDVQALAFLRDSAGEKPVERIEVSSDITDAASEIDALIAAEKAKSQ